MTALSLSAVLGLHWESGVAHSADLLLAFEFSGESSEGWLDLARSHTATSQSENQVKGRFLLDVVIREGTSVLELLTGEDETLLIGRNTFLILNFGFDVLDGVCWLHIESNCLTGEGLDKYLHIYNDYN